MEQSYVYILFSRKNGALYVGVTSDLVKRVCEHEMKSTKGFAERYGIDRLGYYEIFQDITLAIRCEKQLKAGSRQKKIDLIMQFNPQWNDLYEEIVKR